ncbi:uncharacterized protein A1O5_11599 [Cladophialophora psammophila CBS 110553]|uniref:Cytochrome P450 oxidoreductase n=1 Tax=Cladophialophora psammophila CBS 110553 TaxID=1182543 RepID=W9W5M6_9EURO|nr:uncharacterized protein A1O5_11599 [Cladophialophora psammophila CBS 110553]EXJ63278.1 hypothetical protein A1O5_11599 [Cladophialophora psammophila CBS 110553]
MAFFIASSILITFLGLFLYAVLFIGHRGRPPTLPFIGNIHQIPTKGAHFKFTEWARQYGGIFSLKIGTGTIIVLTDRRLVRELLDKKSAVYSDRPTSYIIQKLVTRGDYLLTMPYDSEWRKMRKLIHQEFMESMCEKEHIVLQNAEAVQMMRDFVTEPENYLLHPKRFSNSVIMSILYGLRTPTVRTPHMHRLYDAMEHFSHVMETGAMPPIDIYPFLKFVPQRLLGNWVSRANETHQKMHQLYIDLLAVVKQRRQKQGGKSSLMDRVLDKEEKLNLSNHQILLLGGVALDGGSDTSATALLNFIKAMTCYPDVQKEARKEIDGLMDDSRSPLWSDYKSLPYVGAVVKETMRWRPVGGLIPHATSHDDWVDGKFVPKGSIVLLNAWGLHQDETKFPEPDKFSPARYTGRTLLAPEYAASPDYNSRDHYIYGAGRRLCPGIHLAERNLFLGMAKLLWAFSFEKQIDEAGRVMEPDTNYATGWSEGLITCTKDFPCKVVPRSAERVQTIMREFAQAEAEVFSKYD